MSWSVKLFHLQGISSTTFVFLLFKAAGQSSKSSSGVSSPTFPSGSISPCDFNQFGQHAGMLQDFAAMKLQPMQVRVPTPTWSGNGFSKSTLQSSTSEKGLFCDTPDSTTTLKSESGGSGTRGRSPWDDPPALKGSGSGPAEFGFTSNLIDSVSSLPKPSLTTAKDLPTLLHSMGLAKYIELDNKAAFSGSAAPGAERQPKIFTDCDLPSMNYFS